MPKHDCAHDRTTLVTSDTEVLSPVSYFRENAADTAAGQKSTYLILEECIYKGRRTGTARNDNQSDLKLLEVSFYFSIRIAGEPIAFGCPIETTLHRIISR